ncbi:MAG: response regulator [Pirellulales bacterium]
MVILDVRMVDCDGLAALETIRDRYADLPVLMISGNDNPTYIARAFALGANGFLSKRAPGEQIVAAVRKVAAGEKAWAAEDMRRLTGTFHAPARRRRRGLADPPRGRSAAAARLRSHE